VSISILVSEAGVEAIQQFNNSAEMCSFRLYSAQG
jgi:hypothetical protein